MTLKQIVAILRGALGLLDEQWQIASAYTKDESFMIIRFDSTISNGRLKRIHNLVENTLSEHISDGDRC